MGRKKREKQKKKRQAAKNANIVPDTPGNITRPDQPDLSHLSGEWQEFYRLVIEKVKLN